MFKKKPRENVTYFIQLPHSTVYYHIQTFQLILASYLKQSPHFICDLLNQQVWLCLRLFSDIHRWKLIPNGIPRGLVRSMTNLMWILNLSAQNIRGDDFRILRYYMYSPTLKCMDNFTFWSRTLRWCIGTWRYQVKWWCSYMDEHSPGEPSQLSSNRTLTSSGQWPTRISSWRSIHRYLATDGAWALVTW